MQGGLTRWRKFFTEGARLDPTALPDWMQTEEMQQAMSSLNTFSEKDREYHAYQARMSYLRQQRSIQRHMEELTARAERLVLEQEQARLAAEQARAAEEQMRRAETARQERDLALARAAAAEAELERLRGSPGTGPAAA